MDMSAQRRTEAITVHVPLELKVALDRIARRDGRSLSNLLCWLAAARVHAEQQREPA